MSAHHTTFGPTRRDFLSGLLTTGTLLVAGCGGGAGGGGAEVAVETTGPGPSPGAAGGEVPVVVARNLGPQPASAEGIDGGIRVTAHISAAQGGQFEIPGGAQLRIPAGALAADTEISVLVPTTPVEGQRSYLFGPEGLRFATPARLAMPFAPASDLSVMYAFHASTLNPVVDVGSEKSIVQPLKQLSRTNTHVLFEVEHFSFLSATEATDAGVYLVADFPPETLSPGDLLFYLTETGGIKGWNPGHVAMLVKDDGGRPENPAVRRSPGLLVESGGDAGGVGFGNHEHVRTAYGHTFLGAFRHPDSLTKHEQERVRDFLFSKLGRRYSSMYAQAPLADPVLGEEYNCVGICELALRSAGKSLVSFLGHAGVIVPYHMLRAARPVASITVPAGRLMEVPVYGVVVRPPNVLAAVGVPAVSHYARRHASTITARRLPPEATFVAADLPISVDPNDTAPGYRLSWQPTAAQVGQVFEMELELVTFRANPGNTATGLQVRDQVRRLILMTVVPGSRVHFLAHSIADQVVNVGQDGTLVYAWHDSERRQRRLSRLSPPVAPTGFAPETTLDVGQSADFVPHVDNPNGWMLAQVQETISASRVRHAFLLYNATAGASPDPITLGGITVSVPVLAQSADAPAGDHGFHATALSSNAHVVGTYRRFVRWVEVGPRSYTASTVVDVWWIPKDGTLTRLDVNRALRAAIVAAKPLPGVERADALFGMKVLDVNKAGVALVAASLVSQQGAVTGVDVVAAAIDLNTGHTTLLAHLTEMNYGVFEPDAVQAGRINDRGEAVLTRLQSLRTGGLVTQYHVGLPALRPAQGFLRAQNNFQLNSFNNKGVVGGLRLVAGVAKAAVWTPAADEVVDVHAELMALEPSLRNAIQSSVAQVGDNGTRVGRIITKDADAVELVRDFVMSPT